MATKVAVGTDDGLAWHCKLQFLFCNKFLDALHVLLRRDFNYRVSSCGRGLLYSKSNSETKVDEIENVHADQRKSS